MIELARFEGVAIRWRAVAAPHVGLVLGLLPIVATWDPARLAAPAKLGVAAAACALYAAAMLLLPAAFRRRSRERPASTPAPS
jgi:hypothetical protein